MTCKTTARIGISLFCEDLDPAQISSLIGLKPTEIWRQGEAVNRTLIIHKSSGWRFEFSETEICSVEALVTKFLDTIEPYRTQIANAVNNYSLEQEFFLVLYLPGETPAFTFSNETLCRLASFGANLDVDLVLLPACGVLENE